MLRTAYDISWKSHLINKSLYGSLPLVSDVVRWKRLALAGHVARHDEPAGRLLLWCPEAKRRVGRPFVTLKAIIEEETGLKGNDLLVTMSNRGVWSSEFVNVSPLSFGIG